MHIEPGVVDGAKMVLAYGTAAAAGGYSLKLAADDLKSHSAISFGVRSVLAVVAVFLFFEVFPHFAVGISEVHFILGTTILLLLGAGPAAVGLTGGLLIQGMFFAPTDMPMFFVNVSTLLFPLFVIDALAKRIIPEQKAFVDCNYSEVLKLSFAYQGGVGAKNAGILAAQIIGASDQCVLDKIQVYKQGLKLKVENASKNLKS